MIFKLFPLLFFLFCPSFSRSRPPHFQDSHCLLAFLPPLSTFLQICPQQAQDQPKAHRAAGGGECGTPTLTRTMPELKADVGAPELIHGNREFQQLRPPGAVVMIKHERVVLRSRWLSGAKGDKILRKKHVR